MWTEVRYRGRKRGGSLGLDKEQGRMSRARQGGVRGLSPHLLRSLLLGTNHSSPWKSQGHKCQWGKVAGGRLLGGEYLECRD